MSICPEQRRCGRDELGRRDGKWLRVGVAQQLQEQVVSPVQRQAEARAAQVLDTLARCRRYLGAADHAESGRRQDEVNLRDGYCHGLVDDVVTHTAGHHGNRSRLTEVGRGAQRRHIGLDIDTCRAEGLTQCLVEIFAQETGAKQHVGLAKEGIHPVEQPALRVDGRWNVGLELIFVNRQ